MDATTTLELVTAACFLVNLGHYLLKGDGKGLWPGTRTRVLGFVTTILFVALVASSLLRVLGLVPGWVVGAALSTFVAVGSVLSIAERWWLAKNTAQTEVA